MMDEKTKQRLQKLMIAALREIKEQSAEKVKIPKKFYIASEHRNIITEKETKELFVEAMNQIKKTRGEYWQSSLTREEVEKVILDKCKEVIKEYCYKPLKEKIGNIITEGINRAEKANIQLNKERGTGWENSVSKEDCIRIFRNKIEEIKNLN